MAENNPVAQVTNAAKSAFTVRNMLIGFFTLLGIFALFNLIGQTKVLITPIDAAKDFAKSKGWIKSTTVLMVFATCAAATATNGLML